MKQYFTKYLPTEGEIKERATVVARENGLKTVKSIIEVPDTDGDEQKVLLFTDDTRFPKSACKLVKLFLCSRDIEKSNKVYYENKLVTVTDIMTTDDCFYDDESKRPKIPKITACSIDIGLSLPLLTPIENILKVIGEISREATWVKEGNEFNHEEVGLNGIWQNWNSETPLSGKNIVFIKGPCGHFH